MNTAYPLFPISIITILAYLVTWLFFKWGIFTTKSFRKFWNVLLLATFLVSGLIGLLSVVKINYKLTIPQYDLFLKWHVAVGIGMVVISFIHLSWHLKYYFSGFKNTTGRQSETNPNPPVNIDFAKIGRLLFLLGVVAMINQVVFIREFVSVMAGNELVFGIVMSGWLLLTAWGSYHGRNRISAAFNPNRAINMLTVLSLMPIALIGLLYWLKYLLFPPGTITGVGVAVAGVFLLLFPVCFLSGYLFTAFSTLLSESKNKNLIGKAYAFESFGSLAGGLIFSLILGLFFNSFQILGLTAGVIFLAGIWITGSGQLKKWLAYLAAGILIPTIILITNPDSKIKKTLFPNQQILLNRSTPYGNLVVTEQAGQLNFYEDNTLQFYTDNMMENEEAVHFAMVQFNNPKNVLLISGGISGMMKEILKYKVSKITYLETNPSIVRYFKNLTGTKTFPPQVEFVKSDIRTFLQKNNTKYDVILINLPPPTTLGFNRFYTTEFFEILKKHCTPESVVCTSLPSTANYVEDNVLEVNASLWKTMGRHFQNLLALQGEKNYFLASQNRLSPEITELIREKGIENEYINSNYLDDELLYQRSQLLVSRFESSVKVNHDFYPFMFIKQTFHWLSHFGISYYLLVGIPVLFFLLLFFKLNSVSTGLYTGGFTAASLEVTLMLAFQTFFGSLYLAVAIFFSVFMGGLAAGSLWGHKIKQVPDIKSYYLLQAAIAVFALVLLLFIFLINKFINTGIIVQLFFFILTFILAFSIGFEFYLASKLQPYSIRNTSGLNYSADLAGSAFGAFLTALVLLPVLGLVYTCLIVAGLNIFSAGRAFLGKSSVPGIRIPSL